MPRSFDISADYERDVEAVLRAYREEDYWLARLAASGVDEARLESLRLGGESGTDDTIDVVTLQVIRSDKLPALVTQLHRGDLCIRREETWGPVSGGVALATVAGSIVDAPANVSGTAELAPTGPSVGSRLECRITVHVRVPLIGGKLENFVGTRLADLVVAEQRFTTEWISTRGS
ncbi:DUF2505 domain-containing protein [Mycobacterium sp. 663a-19]|uniref:DUF2505 domain-containing protein n=1 Tax=Mycobacterium sp. 663a-19 TaxID=2986148 RepID=UPI002D1EFBD9|nr:DUF2505 domain-containing protein [Mycobacterium sp. 663a-19]MEB3984260.1 DUF2505 domain-containing protein [Mycobacterium sp. 663a-19]